MVVALSQDILEKSTKPIVIKAFATWCPHCAKMKPLFDNLEKELGKKYIFAEFDVDESEELTKQFNVKSLPTFIFLKDKNEEAGRESGEMSQDELKELIEKHLG